MKIWRTRFHSAHAGLLLFWFDSEQQAHSQLTACRDDHGAEQGVADVKEIDIPTTRAGLIGWLNANFNTDNG